MDSTAGRLLGKAPPGVVSRLVVELKIMNEAQTDSRLECAFIVKEPGSFLGCGFLFSCVDVHLKTEHVTTQN